MLAVHASTDAQTCAWLVDAVYVGERVWQPWLDGEQTIAWWHDERTQPFMSALARCGTLSAQMGDADQGANYLRYLLQLDPDDAMGAVAMFSEVGIVHHCLGDTTPGRRM